MTVLEKSRREQAAGALGLSLTDPVNTDFREWLATVRKGRTGRTGLLALTLHQPWATIMALGHKRMETRSWRHPEDRYPMLLAIHAGAGSDREADALARRMGLLSQAERLPGKAIVALAWAQPPLPSGDRRVQEYLELEENGPERAFGDYSPGRFAWPMDVYPLPEPVPANGRHKLWTPLEETKEGIRRVLRNRNERAATGQSER